VLLSLKKNLKWLAAILALAALATVVGGYILVNQRLRLPLIDETPVRMSAWLDDASSVSPGQGQTVQVAGVKIGDIASVKLVDGRAKVGLDIEPKYVEAGLIREDATALLRPRTALKDMYVQVFPGKGEPVEEGFEIPISRTMTDVDLDEILSTLNPRVRDYLALLVEGAGRGLRGRGDELAEVFRRFGPTMRDLATVNRAVGQERRSLRRLISSLGELTGELAERPEDLTELVQASQQTFSAFAGEDQNLRETVQELPETLRTTRRALEDVQPFADELGPSTRALIPVTRALGEASPAIEDLSREATPLLRDRIRPFVRETRPLARELEPATQATVRTFTEILRAGKVLNPFLNMLAFNPGGKQGPEVQGREEGYLFWLAWTAHQGANLINIDDANGPMRPIFLTGTCTTLTQLVDAQPDLEFGLGLSPILGGLCQNPATSSVRADAKGVARQYVRGEK
jgi:phospholipid/cholesterol/gamma-HCH transport system substrate-binding protein